MAQHLTCPHCETALSIEDEVKANVTCPQCQALIPHGGADGGTVCAVDVEGQSRNEGCGVRSLGLVTLFCVAVCFTGGFLEKDAFVLGRFGSVLLGALLLFCGPAYAFVVLCWATALMIKTLANYRGAAEPTASSRSEVIPIVDVVLAVLAGIVTGAFVLALAVSFFLAGLAFRRY